MVPTVADVMLPVGTVVGTANCTWAEPVVARMRIRSNSPVELDLAAHTTYVCPAIVSGSISSLMVSQLWSDMMTHSTPANTATAAVAWIIVPEMSIPGPM